MQLRVFAVCTVAAAALLAGGGSVALALLMAAPGTFSMPWALGMGTVQLLCAAGLLWALQRAWRRALEPVAAISQQLAQVGEGDLVSLKQPDVQDWVPLARSANIMVARLAQVREAQDATLTALRSQVDADEATGLESRARFMTELATWLASASGPVQRTGAVVLVRVHDLAGLNLRQGRQRGDDLLTAVATLLRQRSVRLETSKLHLARLNGADFGVLVEDTQVEPLTAWLAELAQGLRGFCDDGLIDGTDVAWIGAAAMRQGETPTSVLSLADAMVQASETARLPFRLARTTEPVHATSLLQWRTFIEHALDTGQVRFALFPVVGADGAVLHHEAAARMSLHNGTELTGAQVIPPAERTGRVMDVDLRIIELALVHLANNEGRLAVNVSAQSIGRPVFLQRLGLLLQGNPNAAQRLLMELPESVLESRTTDLQALMAAVTPQGVGVGIDHVNRWLLPALETAGQGLRYIKVDMQAGDARDGRAMSHPMAATLCSLAHSAGCEVMACGVTETSLLPGLFADGFDGVTGKAVGLKE